MAPTPGYNMNIQDDIIETSLPKGVKDFLPVKAARIEYLQQTLQNVFHQWGFRPLIPPSLEFLHVLELGLGERLREKTFRFDDRQSGQLVAIGVEAAIAGPWSAKVEYLYVDMKDASAPSGSSTDFRSNIVRGGINYRF